MVFTFEVGTNSASVFQKQTRAYLGNSAFSSAYCNRMLTISDMGGYH